MDGGTVWNTNLVTAIDRCLELVDSKSQIIVDIAVCGHAEIAPITDTSNSLSNFMRYRDIKSYYSSLDDVLEYEAAEPDVTFRYLFVPSQPMPGGLKMLEFDTAALEPMVELGKQDVANML